jgi:hypothetical protein
MSALAAMVIGVPLVSTAATGYGAYKGLEAATGRFGQDEADAVRRAAAAEGRLNEEAQRRGAEATAAAQAGQDPFASAGLDSLAQQRALAGLDGPEAQQQAIAMLEQSPQFAAMLQQGEQAILANASATGGLRGGDTQGALAQFRPQLLTALIEQQYARLGGLAGAGQQAAAQQGAFGMQGAGLNAQVAQGLGQIQSGSIIGQQAALSNGRNQAINLGLQGIGAGANILTGGMPGGIPAGVAGGAPAPMQQQAPNPIPRGGF